MIKIIFVLFAFIPVLGLSQSKEDMVGFWQDLPIAASGWSDSYLFYADGTYEFHYNQMICDKRLLSVKGKWEIDREGRLVLIANSNTILEGGTLVLSSGSCASEYDIEGGEIVLKQLSETERKTLTISEIVSDTEINSLKTILIGGTRYWKMSSEPNSYY